MNFWVFNLLASETVSFWDSSVWSFITQIGILMVTLIIANTIRRKLKFIRNTLLPTAVIAGIILLVLKFIPWFESIIDNSFMEAVTYHTLGLGFIAMSLKVRNKDKNEKNKLIVMDTGLVTVNTYLIQGIFGLLITIVLFYVGLISFQAAGILLPMGYGQGPGQALNFGMVFEEAGFIGGKSFGLSIATAGFLLACIGGVIYMNILKRKGKLKKATTDLDDATRISSQEVNGPDEIPVSASIDKFTMQVAIVIAIYFLSYGLMALISYLAVNYMGKFGVNTVRPMIYGFNFMFGTILAVLTSKLLVFLKKKKIMVKQYPNNYLLNRISGFMFDLMIISGIAAIKLENVKDLWLPLIIVCVVGALVTFVYVRKVCNYLYPSYNNEAFFSMFGMLTGTASTGMILLREIDDEFQTPAANNLVLQTIPAIAFGFPLMLLVPYAAQSITTSWIVLAILVGMFIVYNMIILRHKIFKKKENLQVN